jgi:hypothetical protein
MSMTNRRSINRVLDVQAWDPCLTHNEVFKWNTVLPMHSMCCNIYSIIRGHPHAAELVKIAKLEASKRRMANDGLRAQCECITNANDGSRQNKGNYPATCKEAEARLSTAAQTQRECTQSHGQLWMSQWQHVHVSSK